MRIELSDSDKFVLCTALLKENDQKLVKSLGILLSSRLNHSWLITTKPSKSHVCFIYENYVAEKAKKHTHKIVELSKLKETSELFLKYPIKANDFIFLLNKLGSLLHSSEYSDKNREESEDVSILKTKKSKALSFFKSFLGESKNKREARDQRQINEQTLQQEKLKLIKSRLSSTQNICNIVFLGTPGSGKTTSIRSLSDSKVINTEVTAKDSLHFIKSETTVALDYGETMINGVKVKMFGNPGQNRFNYMWDITCRNADVFFLLLDSTSPEMLDDLGKYWRIIQDHYKDQIVLIGISHADLYDDFSFSKEEIIKIIGSDTKTHINQVDPRNKQSLLEFISPSISITN